MEKQKRKTSRRFVVWSIVLAVVLVFAIFICYGWFLHRQNRVRVGFARPNFPFSDYSVEELGAMYPQYVNEDVATTQTPEQTHRLFVDKLKAGDLDGAVECCVVKGQQKEMKELLVVVKSRGQWDMMLGDIESIEKDFVGDTMATYSYVVNIDGEKYAKGIEFIKNNQGVWLIKSL